MGAGSRCGRWMLVAGWMAASVACTGKQPMQPVSGGRPYEVLLAGDGDSVVWRVLVSDMAGLPQPEPWFDVSMGEGSVLDNAQTRLARAIVVVTTDSSRFTQTRIRYEKNVYARPQVIVYVQSPSQKELKTYMERHSTELLNLLNRFELNTQIAWLKNKRNVQAEKELKGRYGAEMRIPADMRPAKTDRSVTWLSNNSNTGMQNICVFAGENIDSALYRIKGETDDMHMKTTEGMTTVTQSDGRTIRRGLWEMEGDAMGGAYVAHTVSDSTDGRTVTALAFVYAPEMKKRNKIRQLEAALYTLKLSKQ